jgi:hypothetical protein
VLSDFLFRDDVGIGLDLLRAAQHDLFCVQVLSPQELNPPVESETDLELLDLEDHRAAEVSATPELLRQYHANLQSHRRRVEQAVIRRGGKFVPITTDVPFDRLILDHLRRRSLLG